MVFKASMLAQGVTSTSRGELTHLGQQCTRAQDAQRRSKWCGLCGTHGKCEKKRALAEDWKCFIADEGEVYFSTLADNIETIRV